MNDLSDSTQKGMIAGMTDRAQYKRELAR